MRVSYEWLADFVDLAGIPPGEAADLLTRHGIEISEVHVIDLSRILVGRVIAQDPHPRSRSPLWVHQVDLGDHTAQIIAGAPNAVAGSLVPVALPGTVVPSGKAVRDAFNVGGIAGSGMLCSAAELMIGDDGAGILLLEEGAPGQSLGEIYPPEAVLVAEVLSNRPDCLGHLGIARELAAAAGRELQRDFMPPFTGGIDPPGTEVVTVTVEAPDLCRRYIGAPIRGVEVGRSPAWMRRRLRVAGVRPINNIVDITNYVLLEYGQPLHAFDLGRLEGPQIKVRRAAPGESLACLDGERRTLTPAMLVIADAARPVAVAGVIGGEESAVGEGTRDILLEAACFRGPNVRATAKALGIRTEASSRFEKSLSPELALAGARRAVTLIAEIAKGSVHREWPDEYPDPQEPVRVRVWPVQIDTLLGVHVPLEESGTILRRLGFHLRVEEDGAWDVLPPVFRLDVGIPEDVVEEIGRIHGTDRIPATLPGVRRESWTAASPFRPLDRVRGVLAGAGFQEAVTPALVSSRNQDRLGIGERAMRPVNPLTEEMDALRTSLIPSLLEVAGRNRGQGPAGVGYFEWAHVYLARAEGGQPEEPTLLTALAIAGPEPDAGRAAVLRLKSVLDACTAAAGASPAAYEPGAAPLYHPGRCATVALGTSKIGRLGELHPEVMDSCGLGGRAAVFEIDLDALLGATEPVRSSPVPRYPAVARDLALLVADGVTVAALLAGVRRAGGDLLERVEAFDEYRGAQVEPGMKSLAFSMTFRSPRRTLTDQEVDRCLAAITEAIGRDHGARVRR